MKILWVVNVKLPLIYKVEGKKNLTNVGGWLDQITEMILQCEDNELYVIYPVSVRTGEKGKANRFQYNGMYFEPDKLRNGTLSCEKYIPMFERIIEDYKPDIIHVHGTEFQYAYFVVEAAKKQNMLNRVVVSIQGMVKYYANHYVLGVPHSVVNAFTLKELILKNNISCGKKDYERRGVFEQKTIEETTNVIGRTDWDRGCTSLINPHCRYFSCNETLRKSFYNGAWNYKLCNPHSIFVSQASYPIKGLHFLLEAVVLIKKYFPDVVVNVAGSDLSRGNILKGSSYALYIQRLISKYGLKENVVFLGPQSEDQMKNRMLEANVFVSPSTIENSPNSLGEAMILGVPCISSDVGGVKNLLLHGEEGYIYPVDEVYMLAYYIMKVFRDPKEAYDMGRRASTHAHRTHAAQSNFEQLMNIYRIIMSEG